MPQVIENVKNGEEFKSRHISKDRYTSVAGDLFDSSTIPQADAYLIKQVLHDFSDEKVVDILSAIRRANEKSTRKTITVFIIEFIILGVSAVSEWQTLAADMIMACVLEHAKERTEQEHRQLLEQAGFQFKQLYPTQAPTSIIEAVWINQ